MQPPAAGEPAPPARVPPRPVAGQPPPLAALPPPARTPPTPTLTHSRSLSITLCFAAGALAAGHPGRGPCNWHACHHQQASAGQPPACRPALGHDRCAPLCPPGHLPTSASAFCCSLAELAKDTAPGMPRIADTRSALALCSLCTLLLLVLCARSAAHSAPHSALHDVKFVRRRRHADAGVCRARRESGLS